MAIKKKVTYSVSYTAGTDTLTTKLNSLLQDIVTLILSQNTGLTVLDTITVGSARWTGAPLYDTRPNNLYSLDYNGRHYESDVVFLGANEDNVCISVGFFDGCLVAAMNMAPKVEAEYVAAWTAYGLSSMLPFYATGKQSRWFKNYNANAGRYCIPYRIVNNTISMSVLYWNTEYSRGYSFINGAGESDGTDLVIFPTEEGGGQAGLGAAVWTWGIANHSETTYYNTTRRNQITAFSFSENLSDNKPAVINYAGNQYPIPEVDQQQIINAYYDIRSWSNANNNQAAGTAQNALFQGWHSLCGGSGDDTGGGSYTDPPFLWDRVNYALAANISLPTLTAPHDGISALILSYNLPHLTTGQAYIRKMRIPGWNPECKGEIYLLWAPVLTAYQSGDIVEVGSKRYAIITEGAVCWAARVS